MYFAALLNFFTAIGVPALLFVVLFLAGRTLYVLLQQRSSEERE